MGQESLTFCYMCFNKCSRKITVEDGRITKVERDLESGLPTEWCPIAKGQCVPDIYYHPERLLHPQKRVGERGEGKWKRISWDEALDTIAEKLNNIKQNYGPEHVALALGEPKGLEFHVAQRFATMFGTPNVVTPGYVCGQPEEMAGKYTFGTCPLFDETHVPRLMVLWGCNTINTSKTMHRDFFRANLLKGSKLIVIDPKRIDIAKRADLWVRVRPASDGALAMGLIKIMIEEKLYDEGFVRKWTNGFEKLEQHIQTFSLDDVERVTWVPKEQLKQFVGLYTSCIPASMQLGNSLDQSVNSFQTYRAINIMRALSGMINIPGGDIFLTAANFLKPGRFIFPKDVPHTRDTSKAIDKQFKLALQAGYIPAHSLVKSILEEKPYPVRAVLFMLTNPLVSYPNSEETYKAFMKLDFIAGADIFPTPTTAIADIVLPAAWGAEQNTVFPGGGWQLDLRALPKLIEPPGEAWPDVKWINELARKLALQGFWDNWDEAINEVLKPSGLSWEEFKQKRVLEVQREYKKPEEGIFKTRSGKVEIYSEAIKELGYAAMPLWGELSNLHCETSQDYPLIMTSGKEAAYYLTGYKHVASLRKKTPVPIVELNPETANKLGLEAGDWIYIETKRGRIKQKLTLNSDLDPNIVFAAFGWWFPEEEEDLYQFRKSNITQRRNVAIFD